MDKKRLELIGIGVLAVVFILSFLINIQKARQKLAAQKQPAAAVQSQAGPSLAPLFDTTEPESKRQAPPLEWGRDPFVLNESSSGDFSKISSLKLTGITSVDGKTHRAIINDIIVSAGSKIGKFRVVDVLDDRVLVTDGKETHTLKIVR